MKEFAAALQRTRYGGKFRVVTYSPANMKQVQLGEPINNKADAEAVANKLNACFGYPDTLEPEVLPWNHKWTPNSGPKTKKPATKKRARK